MPAYYRGVVPVIDHDHGNVPGLLKHSTNRPHLPPVIRMEEADPDHGKPGHKHEAAPLPRWQGETFKDKSKREAEEAVVPHPLG